jgi:hypothetical protein
MIFYPEQWGARGDGTHNDGPAINCAILAAINAGAPPVPTAPVDNDGIPTVQLGLNRIYYTETTILLAPTANHCVRIMGAGTAGNGSIIQGASTLATIMIVDTTSAANGNIWLENFKIQGADVTSTGLELTGSGAPYGPNEVRGIAVTNVTTALKLHNARLWSVAGSQFEVSNLASCVTLDIYSNDIDDHATTDSNFTDCHFCSNYNEAGDSITTRLWAENGGLITGLGFTDCSFRKGSLGVQLQVDGSFSPSDHRISFGIQDVWFNPGCMHASNDNPMATGSALSIYATSTTNNAIIEDINFIGMSLSGYFSASIPAISCNAAGGSTVQNITISNCSLQLTQSTAIAFVNTVGIQLSGNRLSQIGLVPSPGYVFTQISFTSCSRFICNSNSSAPYDYGALVLPYIGITVDPYSSFFTVVGNQFAGSSSIYSVYDTTSGTTPKAVGDNA